MRCELLDIPAGAKFTAADWKRAAEHELEHTRDPACAAVIGAQHMIEHGPAYYDELEKMERGLGQYQPNPGLPTFWAAASIVSTGLSAYHGYKRNDSVGWAVAWGLLGGLFPIITPAVAFAQGFADPKGT